ncbi:MAG TPA: sulfite oxidase [Bryobacteraceae bacterium]|nr:sulfite oxidase [Bryobacteraceae bacterium]
MHRRKNAARAVDGFSNRRELLAGIVAATAVATGQDLITTPGKRPLILHNDRPEDLETPPSYFTTWLTPNDVFFVRQHLPRPTVAEATYRLAIDGKVSKQIELTTADLRKLPQQTVAATLECTGNGRGLYRPRVAGVQWMRGAIGNAEWTGPRLSDVLKLVGADLNAAYVTVNGADTGVAKTPDFIRSFPMRKALHPATLLALQMNREPIPDMHGFPVRLVVPGWDGTSWVKWVTNLSVANDPNTGFFMNPGYRFPKHAVPPGGAANPADLEIIEGMPVKSSIASVADQDHIPLAPTLLRGIAWAGEQRITRVEISTDAGRSWHNAELSPQDLPFAWRLWTFKWTPLQEGYYTIMSRATDSAGNIQPIVATWNPSGYLYNAIDRVGVNVEKTA